jgi:fructokinase
LTVDEFDPAMFGDAFCLHATGISLTVEPRDLFIIKAIREARQSGLLVSFDAGFPTGEGERAQKLVREAMSLAHLLKVNLPELIYWLVPTIEPVTLANILENPGEPANLDVLKDFCRKFHQKSGARILLCTLGAYGSIVTGADFQIFAPPHKLEAVAGVGAGDAYVAAVLHCLARMEKGPEIIADLDSMNWLAHASFANAAGALATRTVSASEGLPTLAEVETLLAGSGHNCGEIPT